MVTEKMIEVATMPCECTKIAQDETCPVGYPSLLCEVCGGKGHVPYVKLDGAELWEIVFGVNSDAATEITDAQYDQIAKAINDVFVDPLRTQAALSTDSEGWVALAPSYHRDPYHVEKIMGIWHLRFRNPNGSALTISKHDTAEQAMATVPAAPAAKSGDAE